MNRRALPACLTTRRDRLHISEGILSPPVLVGGAVAALAGLALGMRAAKVEDTPRVGVTAAALFVASLLHVPVGVGSAHLMLGGLAGLLLGWAAFPAFFIALLLQGLLFQFGGLTTLGVNTCIMALPAVAAHYLFRRRIRDGGWGSGLAAFLAGAFALLLSGILLASALYLTGDQAFFKPAAAIFAVHLPLMALEGAICVFCISFFRKVCPRILERTPVDKDS